MGFSTVLSNTSLVECVLILFESPCIYVLFFPIFETFDDDNSHGYKFTLTENIHVLAFLLSTFCLFTEIVIIIHSKDIFCNPTSSSHYTYFLKGIFVVHHSKMIFFPKIHFAKWTVVMFRDHSYEKSENENWMWEWGCLVAWTCI